MRFTRRAALSTALVLAISAAGQVIAWQGWKSRSPDERMYATQQAQAIVQHGALPDRGTLTDFGSYFPPGAAWLIVPGVLTTADARLVELAGCALLYAGAIAA